MDDKRLLIALLEEKKRRQAASNLDAYARSIIIPGVPLYGDDDDDNDCEEFYPDLVTPAEHHQLILWTLDRVSKGEIKRVMIFMPPGSAKSTYASVVFPTAEMGRKPGFNVICASYASKIASKFGRKCRAIARSKEFQCIFGCELTGDNAAVDDWSLTNGSTYMCGGLLSGITGNRADGVVIDDPIKGRADAESDTIRKKVVETYLADVLTRMKPSAWQVIIQTRWHENDLSGTILPEDYDGRSGWVKGRDEADWFVLNLPAQARDGDVLGRKPGEWLWTNWFPPEWWEQLKKTQTSRNWSSMYQQVPTPDEGDFFQADWLRYYDTAPPRHLLKIYGASDYAVTDDAGDYTVHLVVGVDAVDNIYVLDVWREQTESDEWVEAFCDMVLQWKPLEWAEEAGQINKSVGPFLRKRQRERKAYTYRRQYTSATSKPVRAQAIRAITAMNMLFLPANAPWTKDLVHEMKTFPNGRNDDQVDTLSLIGRMLDRMASGKKEEKPKPQEMTGIESVTLNRLFEDHENELDRR